MAKFRNGKVSNKKVRNKNVRKRIGSEMNRFGNE